MKKIILLFAIFYFTSFGALRAQIINPIPSYNYQTTTVQSLFGEIRVSNNGKEKRDMDVEISTASHGSTPIFAKVWVVKKNGNIVKGPFIIHVGEPLSVPIDNGKWGVIVNCDWNVFIDVWTNH
ncbi:MAG: hypothetical protein WCK34_13985 [Bacteroidota bacterium]